MNTTFILSLLLAVVTVYSHPGADFKIHLEKEWSKFKETYGRVFANGHVEKTRKAIFEDNLKNINEHNLLYSRGLRSYNLAINEFTDMTHKEFKSKTGSLRVPSNYKRSGSTFLSPLNVGELPAEVDWRKEGLVTRVKDQLECGSCWTFSTTGAIEGQHARKTGKLVSLSEQDLMDCSLEDDNDGCQGGLMVTAFKHVIKANGIDTEESYPYKGFRHGNCTHDPETVGATISGYVEIESGNERQLMEAVATVGPVSIGINSGDPDFKSIGPEGIYEYKYCDSIHLDHALLIVGYGTENGQDYWLIKNSWGTTFGAGGYFKMARNKDNMCGVASLASYPVV